jgi:hypothetical protein
MPTPPATGHTPKTRNQHTAIAPALSYHETRITMAKILLDQGETYASIRKKTGVSEATIARLRKGERDVIPHLAEALKKQLAAKIEVGKHLYLDNLLRPEIVDNSNSVQSGTVFGILYDKGEIEAGRPTVRFGLEVCSDEELLRRSAEGRVLRERLGLTDDHKTLDVEALTDPASGSTTRPKPKDQTSSRKRCAI